LKTPESRQSQSFRRACGVAALAGLHIGIAGLIAGAAPIALVGFFLFFLLPHAVMMAHLNLTSSMTPEEQASWRRELWWNHRRTIAAWAYLWARDLGARARGFAPVRD
jgi:hypothetical protein